MLGQRPSAPTTRRPLQQRLQVKEVRGVIWSSDSLSFAFAPTSASVFLVTMVLFCGALSMFIEFLYVSAVNLLLFSLSLSQHSDVPLDITTAGEAFNQRHHRLHHRHSFNQESTILQLKLSMIFGDLGKILGCCYLDLDVT